MFTWFWYHEFSLIWNLTFVSIGMYISYQIEIQCMRYASCTITWMFKYIPYPDLLTDLSEKYIRLVVHILVLIHRVRVSDSGTNYSKFSQEAVKRGVHSLHKEVPLWLGIVDGINNSTYCVYCFAPLHLLSKGRNSFWMGSAPQMESNLSWQKSWTQKFCVVPL